MRGVDCFVPFYAEADKRANLTGALATPAFELVEADLRDADLSALLDGVDSGVPPRRPGRRADLLGRGVRDYVSLNVLATQRLLEACRGRAIDRLVYASSSSIYGQAARYPTDGATSPARTAPHGVTKLAGEHLCSLWREPRRATVSLRCFTVYGPRQRPDMALHRLIEHGLARHHVPALRRRAPAASSPSSATWCGRRRRRRPPTWRPAPW